MTAIKTQHGPQGVVFSSKSGSLSGHLFQLATAFGSPNTFTHRVDMPGRKIDCRQSDDGRRFVAMDIANTRYMVSLVTTFMKGIEVAETHELMMAQEKGAKWSASTLVCPSSPARRMNGMRSNRAATLPVLMAMCHVMINENCMTRTSLRATPQGLTNWQKQYKRPRRNGRKSKLMCLLMSLFGSPEKWPPARLMLSSARAIVRRSRKKKLICGA